MNVFGFEIFVLGDELPRDQEHLERVVKVNGIYM